MKRSGILNADLSHAIASLGHGDQLLVVDAGFPIPTASWRIDLALAPGVPDLTTVLALLAEELIVEAVTVAEDVPTHNAPLHEWLLERWPGVPLSTITHAEMLGGAAGGAKAIVRTGAFTPWGNVMLTSGVDVKRFFSAPGVVVPEYYRDRLESSSDG